MTPLPSVLRAESSIRTVAWTAACWTVVANSLLSTEGNSPSETSSASANMTVPHEPFAMLLIAHPINDEFDVLAEVRGQASFRVPPCVGADAVAGSSHQMNLALPTAQNAPKDPSRPARVE